MLIQGCDGLSKEETLGSYPQGGWGAGGGDAALGGGGLADLNLMPTFSGLPGTGQLLLRLEGQILSCRIGGNDPTARTIRSENVSTGLTLNLAQSKPWVSEGGLHDPHPPSLGLTSHSRPSSPQALTHGGLGSPSSPGREKDLEKAERLGALGGHGEAFLGVWLSLVPPE